MSLNLTGNNLIPYPYNDSSPKILNGITFTVNNDGSVTANGTSTATANFLCLSLSSLSLKKGEYTLSSGLADDNTPITYGVTLGYTYENGNRTTVATKNGSISIILTENAMCDVVVTVRANQTLENLVFKPMLNKGTTALPYEPYKSINPENIKVNTGTETKDVEKVVVAKSPNLIPYPYYAGSSWTTNGITYVADENGFVTANGTATDAAYYWFANTSTEKVKAGITYTLSGCPEGGSTTTYRIGSFKFGNTYDYGQGVSFTPAEDTPIVAFFRVEKGQTVENLVFKPMLNKGATALPYQKYDREVVWSKTSTSDETTNEETTV